MAEKKRKPSAKEINQAIIPSYNPVVMLQEFLKNEASGGLILVFCAIVAMILANSPLAGAYHHMLHETKGVVGIGPLVLEKDIIHWINDGLMAIFFFLVGLEIKREVLEGMLSSKEQIILQVVAAIGGMAVPGAIFFWINQGDPAALKGWAVPTATDIAFAVGILSLLGKRVPISLKVFLLALAIIDDLGAIIIIALFYTSGLEVINLLIGLFFMVALFAANRMGINRGSAYLFLGVALWICVLKSGVHATLAGVVCAFAIPLHVAGERRSLLRQLEHDLNPFVAFFVLPIFAFANAGVNLDGVTADVLTDPVTMGIIAGLFLGKQLGITGFTWAFVKMGIAKLPVGMDIKHVWGVSILAGIGFTMSIFIATLGYFGHDLLLIEAKLGILVGSVLSAIFGLSVLWMMRGEEIDQVKEANENNPNKPVVEEEAHAAVSATATSAKPAARKKPAAKKTTTRKTTARKPAAKKAKASKAK